MQAKVFGGCGSLSTSCLSNSGCLGLSGLNLTDCACVAIACGGMEHPTSGGGGGGGGLVHVAGGGLRVGIGGGLGLGSCEVGLVLS